MGFSNEEKQTCRCDTACAGFMREISGGMLGVDVRKDIKSIQIVGYDNKDTRKLYKSTQTAVVNLGLDTAVEYIADEESIKKYQAEDTPVVLINNHIAFSSKKFRAKDIEALFTI